jgi:PhzF family phenazine biosynthesis protein
VPHIPILTVDAFTDQPFRGNPAAVCLLDGPAPEPWMRLVARELNLSETAFVHPAGDAWALRWFTPTKEVDLCGHATLASAHALWETKMLRHGEPARFDTRSGRLTCRQGPAGRIAMDFPANPPAPAPAPVGLWEALRIEPAPVLRNRLDHVVVATDEATVQAVRPDFQALARISDVHGFVVTAPGAGGVDYVCRYFVPAYGIDEDPVTGSIQTALGPYWAQRLGKAELVGKQVSARGGTFWVKPMGGRVELAGFAVTTVRGELAA